MMAAMRVAGRRLAGSDHLSRDTAKESAGWAAVAEAAAASKKHTASAKIARGQEARAGLLLSRMNRGWPRPVRVSLSLRRHCTRHCKRQARHVQQNQVNTTPQRKQSHKSAVRAQIHRRGPQPGWVGFLGREPLVLIAEGTRLKSCQNTRWR